MRKLQLLLAVGVLVGAPAWGADSLITWKGEIRVRGELDGRDFQNATSPNMYSLLRTRLGADVRPAKNLFISFFIQDSRVFGQRVAPGAANTTSNSKNIDLYEGFIRIENLATDHLSVSLGRMGLSYGAERLIGRLDWTNVGRVFDGALIRFDPVGHSLDLFVTDVVELSAPPSPVTRSTVTSIGSEGYLFWGGHYTFSGLQGQTLSAYGYQETSHADTTTGELERSRWTAGGRGSGSIAGFFYEAEGAYQFGTQQDDDISSLLLVGLLGYSFDPVPIRVLAAYEYLSGTPAGSSDVKTFDPMFPTAHKFWGIMDYFTNIPLQTFNRGLQDAYVGFTYRPVNSLSITVTGHDLRLAESFVGRMKLGREVDLVTTYNHSKHLLFELGGGGFFPDEIMEFSFGGTDPGFWGYLTVHARF